MREGRGLVDAPYSVRNLQDERLTAQDQAIAHSSHGLVRKRPSSRTNNVDHRGPPVCVCRPAPCTDETFERYWPVGIV